jgi:hypothetical protein
MVGGNTLPNGSSAATDEEQQVLLGRSSNGFAVEKPRPAAAQRSGLVRVLAAVAVAVSWMFVSSLLILLNKHLLKDLKFG